LAKPVMMTVDDDPAVLAAVTRDLQARFAEEFQIVAMPSAPPALQRLARYALRGQPVAMIISDQRMPGVTGIELLERAKREAPEAKLVLLTAYADTDVAIRAINDIQLDRYLMKPWDPPEEKLYPIVEDLLEDWRRDRRGDRPPVTIVGHRWSDRSHELKTFLTRNYVPYAWLDLERDEEARRLHDLAHALPTDLPLVLIADGDVLRAPTTLDVADALGLRTSAEKPLYDLSIVGGGPAGLAAAVYAASEGLDVVLIEGHAPGGQAGQSAAIENYLGFPKGLSGADLAARAMDQVRRFEAEVVLAREVVGFEARGPVRAVRFADGTEIEARALLVASGVSYRRLEAPGVSELTGRGVYYGASASQFAACEGDDVYVIGAANSAGQAVVNLARYARRVVLLVRGPTLEASMSHYLVEQIRNTPNVEVRLQTEIVAGAGDEHLEGLTLLDHSDDTKGDVDTNWLFVFIGATPRTDWLGDGIARDEKGFVMTGRDLPHDKGSPQWPLDRIPFMLETSIPGVFAAGDVRFDSMKRVASAVGEGAMSVHLVHRYLATI
jgi:thioredoxin reductase (NADPH)